MAKELEAAFRDAEQKLIGSIALFVASVLILVLAVGLVGYAGSFADEACECVEVVDGP